MAIHTKSAWVQVKRGEYISPGINLFELGLHWNNWTLQRAMISECSYRSRDRWKERERGEERDVYFAATSEGREEGRKRATIRDEIKDDHSGKKSGKGEIRRKEGKDRDRETSAPSCIATGKCNLRETYAPACDRHPRKSTDLFRYMRLRQCQILCFYSASCVRIYEVCRARYFPFVEKKLSILLKS